MAPLLICPGIHDPSLTHSFLSKIELPSENLAIFPTAEAAPYSPTEMLSFFRRSALRPPSETSPLRIVAFSAGVVGAIAAAHLWQLQGGQIAWILALDGWGVPAWANFPVYRLSHDSFTHWSSQLTGGSTPSFYAEPAVDHLELWRSPHLTVGWHVSGCGLRHRTTAATFIQEILTETL
jgi:hypothetical protein